MNRKDLVQAIGRIVRAMERNHEASLLDVAKEAEGEGGRCFFELELPAGAVREFRQAYDVLKHQADDKGWTCWAYDDSGHICGRPAVGVHPVYHYAVCSEHMPPVGRRLVCPKCHSLVKREACVLVSETLFQELTGAQLICPECEQGFFESDAEEVSVAELPDGERVL